jgi:hypothetical protein
MSLYSVGELLVIRWLDAFSDEDLDPKDLKSEYARTTVGFYISGDDGYMRVFTTKNSDGSGDIFSIPTPTIVTVTRAGFSDD